MRNLNGWQRLWVVFAGATFVYALVWGFSNASTYGVSRVNENVISGFANPPCQSILEMRRSEFIFSFSDEVTKESPCYELYQYLSYRYHHNRDEMEPGTADGYVKYIEALNRESFLASLVPIGIALGTWLVGVLLLYAVGPLVSWVRKGFSASRKRP